MSKQYQTLIQGGAVILMASLWGGFADRLLAQNVPSQASQGEGLELLQQRQNLKQFNAINSNAPMSQVTNVNQLRDVEPTDWAYEALRSLVERYGCIVGYPDRTYRGDRALTRWEFAAGLNACLNQIERLLQDGVTVVREDLDILKRLTQEFQAELAALGARIDNLEARVSNLEDHQFSTTTKLQGEAVFALSGIVGGEKNNGTENIPQITTFGYRSRLELNTSFTGKDLLYTRLATGNIAELTGVAGTDQANLAFAQPDDNQLNVEVLYYNFPVNDNISVWAEAAGGAFDDFTNTLNVLDGDGGSGALSVFGTRNPIYYQGEGSGVGAQGNYGAFQWSIGYLANSANDPTPGNGLFNGGYATLVQLGYVPNENFGAAFIYNHGYNTLLSGTNSRFRTLGDLFLNSLTNTVHDSYSLGFSWKLTDSFVVGGWGGYTQATNLNTVNTDQGTFSKGSLDLWNWAITLAFPDLLTEGSTAGIILGMPPWISSSNIVLPDQSRLREDSAFHIEGFYDFALTDNINITPGIIVVTSPNNDSNNSPLVIGVVRTTFTF